MQDGHRLGLSAFSRPIVQERHTRLDRVNERGGVRARLPMVRDDEEIHRADRVSWTHQVELFVDGQVAEMEPAELSEGDMNSDECERNLVGN